MKKGTLIYNRYRVLGRIGKGGTSEVYKVYDTHVTRELAMKVVRTGSPNMISLARGEIDMLKSIKYPLFPAIYDAFVLEGQIVIVTEFIYGRRLDEVIESRTVSVYEALRIVGRIADALSYLHDFKPPILYLYLQPENIIINENSLPVLVDFGIACRLMDKRVCMGTYGYSPPEQHHPDFGAIDERADIFSLGMTYLAIRSGKPPDRDYRKNIEFIKKSRVFNKREKAFLLRAVSYKKSDRFSCMTEVRREIERIRDYPKKTVKKLAIGLVFISIAAAGLYLLTTTGQKASERRAALSMVGDASKYMLDGEYTKDGIGIIKGFVQSGCLNRDTEQKFMYEMARNSLYIQHDYKSAAVYFSKLDRDIYPFATDYENLCRMISGFDEEYDNKKLIGIYYGDVLAMTPCTAKYENLIIAADMFGMYDNDRLEGIKKAITVLKSAQEEIDSEVIDNASCDKDTIGTLTEKIQRDIIQKENEAKEIYRQRMKGGLTANEKTTFGN